MFATTIFCGMFYDHLSGRVGSSLKGLCGRKVAAVGVSRIFCHQLHVCQIRHHLLQQEVWDQIVKGFGPEDQKSVGSLVHPPI